MKSSRKPSIPVSILFLVIGLSVMAGRTYLEQWGMDITVLVVGNIFLFLITLLSLRVAVRGLGNKNPHAFVRSVYGSIMIKLFLCLIAAFIYIAANGKGLNKPALFTLMGLYLVYTFLEVSALLKLLKHKPHE